VWTPHCVLKLKSEPTGNIYIDWTTTAASIAYIQYPCSYPLINITSSAELVEADHDKCNAIHGFISDA